MIDYHVAFWTNGTIGSFTATMHAQITNSEQVKSMREYLERELGVEHVVIIGWQELRQPLLRRLLALVTR